MDRQSNDKEAINKIGREKPVTKYMLTSIKIKPIGFYLIKLLIVE
jgi:hypothetical protein